MFRSLLEFLGLAEKPYAPPSPEEERQFRRLRADARAIRRWSTAHRAGSWSYKKLVTVLQRDPKFSKWDRERLIAAIEEDADT